MNKWMAEILPPLCNITQGCYAITCRAARHESALLRTPVRQQCWFDSCKDDMCKHLAQHGKQSYPSIIATLRLVSFSFIHNNHGSSLYRFGDKARYCSKIRVFHTPLQSTSPLGGGVPVGILPYHLVQKNYTVSQKNVPTLASCSFNKHRLILIIFGTQHQQSPHF